MTVKLTISNINSDIIGIRIGDKQMTDAYFDVNRGNLIRIMNFIEGN